MIQWSIKDICEVIDKRRKNQYDVNIVISGSRGTGKSSLAYKILARFKEFKPWKHIVYDRESCIELLQGQKFSVVWDDESINSGFKRSFYEKDQQQLIRYLNMYRDNFNIYTMCIPNFYDLDKALRSLVKIHIHVIRRGLAVIHVAKDGNLFSTDPWETAYNMKMEQAWKKKISMNPNWLPPYYKISTFKGYLKFGDITPQQRELYQEIKDTKRKKLHEKQMEAESKDDPISIAYKNVIDMVLDGKYKTMYEVERNAIVLGLKVASFKNRIRELLRERGEERTLSTILKENDMEQVVTEKKRLFGLS